MFFDRVGEVLSLLCCQPWPLGVCGLGGVCEVAIVIIRLHVVYATCDVCQYAKSIYVTDKQRSIIEVQVRVTDTHDKGQEKE